MGGPTGAGLRGAIRGAIDASGEQR